MSWAEAGCDGEKGWELAIGRSVGVAGDVA